jgi:hypothetical protein
MPRVIAGGFSAGLGLSARERSEPPRDIGYTRVIRPPSIPARSRDVHRSRCGSHLSRRIRHVGHNVYVALAADRKLVGQLRRSNCLERRAFIQGVRDRSQADVQIGIRLNGRARTAVYDTRLDRHTRRTRIHAQMNPFRYAVSLDIGRGHRDALEPGAQGRIQRFTRSRWVLQAGRSLNLAIRQDLAVASEPATQESTMSPGPKAD